MPLPSEPSTRLSRVVPHEACLATSTSGMPYLANSPLSLATNSGPASLSAMNPSIALVTSGPAPCANAPAGKFSLAAASNAAVPPVAFRSWRRLKPRREVGLVGFVMGIVVLLRQCVKRGRPIGVTALGAEGRVPGRPRNGGVTIRMSGLKGRHQWRQHKLFKLRAKPFASQKTYLYQYIIGQVRRNIAPHPEPVIRILNLQFAQFLCVAQELGKRRTSVP